jgi:hypothetical protein
MAAEAVASANCPLEVYTSPRAPIGHCRSPKGRGHGSRGEPVRATPAHREARAIHCDALPFLEIIVPAADAKLPARRDWRNALDGADVVDEAGEHY